MDGGSNPVKDHLGLHGPKVGSLCAISYAEEAPETFPWVWSRPSWRRPSPQALVLQPEAQIDKTEGGRSLQVKWLLGRRGVNTKACRAET